jgi:two-component system, NarL family, sensor kinase
VGEFLAFRISFRRIAWVAFAFALVLLMAMGLVAYRTTNLLVTSENWVAHTQEVQANLEDIRADIMGAEFSRRGYTITNDESLLNDYRSAVEDLPRAMARLRQLTADHPSRKSTLDDLQSLIDRSLTLQAGAVESRRSGRPDLQQDIRITRQTAQLTDQARALIQTLENDETRLLSERQRASDVAYQRTIQVLAIAFGVVLFLLAAEFSLLNIEFRRHERTQEIAQQSRELVNAFFSSSSLGLGILDRNLRFRRANQVLAGMGGSQPEAMPGKSLEETFGRGLHADDVARNVITSGQPMLDCEISHSTGGKETEARYWSLNYFPIRGAKGEVAQVGVIAVDVTARRNAEAAIRRLTARLLNLQDQERRRIAREIHDSLGQYLAGLKITLDMMENPAFAKKAGMLSECSDLVQRCISETRTISHLLHPPLLDEAGFASAASWFVTGFSQRSGIPVTLDLPPDLARLPNEVEIALFRVLQESLTNVHRHSESKSAEICLKTAAGQVTLEVRDHGRGIPQQRLQQMQVNGTQSGVGLAGMRERVRELGGAFEIRSDRAGTAIRVSIPLAAGADAGKAIAV